MSFNAAETGFDPVRVSDNYSNIVNGAIFETLLTYDYLARPAKLVPGVAEAMPEVTEEGRTYTIRLRKGVMFTPDPAFKGKPRELTADDYIYTFKRFVDPKNRSPWAFLFEGHIEGLDEYIEAARKNNKFDYEGKVAGPAGDRPPHAAHPPQAAELRLPLYAGPHAGRRRWRARSSRPTATN